MKIVTHSGHFHADELLGVAVLLLKFPQSEVVRSREESVILAGDIVIDVGQVYDPDKLRFDHHQREGAGKRSNGIPYASFGLVWKQYGQELAGGEEEANLVDERLVTSIDAEDNAVSLSREMFEGVKQYSLGDYFESFTRQALSLADYDKGFFEALPHAQALLEREISIAKKVVSDWHEVQSIFDQSERKEVIVLPEGKSWKRVLVPTEALFVVFPRPDGQWSARTVPKKLHGYEVKKPFPASWGGLSQEELRKVSGVGDATFCHRGLWLANALSREGALELAERALNA